MLIFYKVMISLAALSHFFGFVMASFMPVKFVEQFGLEYNDSLLRLSVHFGYLLLIFGTFQTIAALWTFKGKVEGIQLGLVAGIAMTLIVLPDLLIVKKGIDYSLIIMRLLVL